MREKGNVLARDVFSMRSRVLNRFLSSLAGQSTISGIHESTEVARRTAMFSKIIKPHTWPIVNQLAVMGDCTEGSLGAALRKKDGERFDPKTVRLSLSNLKAQGICMEESGEDKQVKLWNLTPEARELVSAHLK